VMVNTIQERSRLSAARAFVVQFHAADEVNPDRRKGKVEHVSSGRTQYFSSKEELWCFMEQVLNNAPNSKN
jgi:hypothetical protein